MENIHGVDVSWLHRSSGDPSSSPPPIRQTSSPKPPQQRSTETQTNGHASKPVDIPKQEPSQPQQTQQSPKSPKRPQPTGRQAEKSGNESRSPGKRSWMSSLSSKFSSQSSHPAVDPPMALATKPSAAPAEFRTGALSEQLSPPSSRADINEESVDSDIDASTPPQKSGGFFSHALRRLSTGSQQNPGVKVADGGSLCPRKILNVDERRDRCNIKELDQSKLRRVSFSVDVEIAGHSRYISEAEELDPIQQQRDKRAKERSEGEALKQHKFFDDEDDAPKALPVAPSPKVEPKKETKKGPKSVVKKETKKDSKKPVQKEPESSDEDFGWGPPKPKKPKKPPPSTPLHFDDDFGWGATAIDGLTGRTTSRGSLEGNEKPLIRSSLSEAGKPSDQSSPPVDTKASLADESALVDDTEGQEDTAKAQMEQAPAAPEKDSEKTPEKTPEKNPEKNSEKSKEPNVAVEQSPAETNNSPDVRTTDKDKDGSESKPIDPSSQSQAKPLINGAVVNSKPQDRPTTDPLRIYRRCCALRESPVLKRISEQLGNTHNYSQETPGVVNCLNLKKSRMQLPDIICLADWLAIVPVKKLLLEDANLSDEGVRMILAGLLATRSPELCKRKRKKSDLKALPTISEQRHYHGYVEKISLKNNPKLTAEAWRQICYFINMSRSIKAIDLSLIPFPETLPVRRGSIGSLEPGKEMAAASNLADVLYKSISERLAGDFLEELIIAECGLSSYQVGKVVDAAAACKLKRLGLAGNRLEKEGLEHVARFLRAGCCVGIDLGGNDLRHELPIITDTLDDQNKLWVISLANCNLDAEALEPLCKAISKLPDFRMLDLSHNRLLFGSEPSALGLLRKVLPKLKLLKRIHLVDVSMSPAHVIGLAEVLPEIRNLAHINILENPQISALASASDTAAQEEAVALYASLMTAVRLSRTICCIDVDVPSAQSTEVVKALARQAVAYCLRNMEALTEGDAVKISDAAAALPNMSDVSSGIEAPEVLMHLAEHESGTGPHPHHGKSASEDYMVGGAGVAKALSYFLNANDLRRISVSGTGTPTQILDTEAGRARAKEMSVTLLESARKFRARLENVVMPEYSGNEEVFRRLQFIDSTLKGMIERFEVEYPDLRPAELEISPQYPITPPPSAPGHPAFAGTAESYFYLGEDQHNDDQDSDGETSILKNNASSPLAVHSHPTRRGSETELHSKVLGMEEGKMHRFGQQFRRNILPPRGQDDHLHGTTDTEVEPEHLAALRAKLEEMPGSAWRDKIQIQGFEKTMNEFASNAEELKRLEETDPDGFQKFREAQEMAQKNLEVSKQRSLSGTG